MFSFSSFLKLSNSALLPSTEPTSDVKGASDILIALRKASRLAGLGRGKTKMCLSFEHTWHTVLSSPINSSVGIGATSSSSWYVV